MQVCDRGSSLRHISMSGGILKSGKQFVFIYWLLPFEGHGVGNIDCSRQWPGSYIPMIFTSAHGWSSFYLLALELCGLRTFSCRSLLSCPVAVGSAEESALSCLWQLSVNDWRESVYKCPSSHPLDNSEATVLSWSQSLPRELGCNCSLWWLVWKHPCHYCLPSCPSPPTHLHVPAFESWICPGDPYLRFWSVDYFLMASCECPMYFFNPPCIVGH